MNPRIHTIRTPQSLSQRSFSQSLPRTDSKTPTHINIHQVKEMYHNDAMGQRMQESQSVGLHALQKTPTRAPIDNRLRMQNVAKNSQMNVLRSTKGVNSTMGTGHQVPKMSITSFLNKTFALIVATGFVFGGYIAFDKSFGIYTLNTAKIMTATVLEILPK